MIQQRVKGEHSATLENLLPCRGALKVLKALERSIDPYVFFWDEWIVHEDCRLSAEEVRFISQLMSDNFEFRFRRLLAPKKVLRDWRLLADKLDASYPVFKQAVILEFLFLAIRISRKNTEQFFDGPICWLDLSEDMKACFRAFGHGTVRQIFCGYSAERLNRPWVFDKVRRFYLTAKAEGLLTYKPTAYETEKT